MGEDWNVCIVNTIQVWSAEEFKSPLRKIREDLKGLSHEIFGPVYWPVWMHLGLNKNCFWFLNFEEAPSIWGSHFKFWCVSVQTFSEILRISRRFGTWGLSCQFFSENWWISCESFSENWGLSCQSFSEILQFSKKYFHPNQSFSENC